MSEPTARDRRAPASPDWASGPGPDLRAEFALPSLDDWRREVAALLKGVPFEKAMETPTAEGITLRGLYTRADAASLDFPRSLPGDAPFVRGAHLLGHRLDPWEIVQEIRLPEASAFAEALRQDLAAGQTAVALVLDSAGRAGLDPDAVDSSRVGRGGTSISTFAEISRALEPVLPSQPGSAPVGQATSSATLVPLFLHAGAASLPAAALAGASFRARGTDLSRLRGSFGTDPLADALAGSTIPLDEAYDRLAALTDWLESREPGDYRARSLVAWGVRWREAGGTAVDELAYALGSAVQALRELEARGIDPRAAATRLLFGLAAGPQPLLEIAKLRAARLLWGRVCEACGFEDPPASMWIHARTLSRNQSGVDVHTNALRATNAALSAILGGCDSLTVLPFDGPLGLPAERARRLARNTQLILRDECRLDAVIDAAGGAHAVEALTAEVADEVWERFREIEMGGGLRRLLEAGEPQARVARAAQSQRQAVATRREILVGANQYPNPSEPSPVHRRPDHSELHRRRSAEIAAYRGARDTAAVRAALGRLEAIQADGVRRSRAERFEAAVETALAGATLGELMGTTSAGAPPFPGLAARRLAEDFEELRARARGPSRPGLPSDVTGSSAGMFDSRSAAPTINPVVFLAGFGPAADYRPRLEFTRSFFLLAGLDPIAPAAFEDSATAVDEAVQAAVDCRAAVAVIVSTDARYPQVVPAAASSLKRLASVKAVALAGLPADPAVVEAFRASGVDEFLHLRCDAPAVLGSLLEKSGGRP